MNFVSDKGAWPCFREISSQSTWQIRIEGSPPRTVLGRCSERVSQEPWREPRARWYRSVFCFHSSPLAPHKHSPRNVSQLVSFTIRCASMASRPTKYANRNDSYLLNRPPTPPPFLLLFLALIQGLGRNSKQPPPFPKNNVSLERSSFLFTLRFLLVKIPHFLLKLVIIETNSCREGKRSSPQYSNEL